VHDEQLTRDERVLRVRFAADPASVPGARRFVADGLRAWGHDDLVDDAQLCVSELAGNAALHGNSTYIEVYVVDLVGAIRVAVEDDGPAPAAVVAPRTTLPGLDAAFDDELDEIAELDDLERLLDAPATGRGLAIVSVLASDWGVEELGRGKRVWADLAAGGSPVATPAHAQAGRRREHTTSPARDIALPDGWIVVRLEGCPVELSIRQDQHLDELVRELTLMSVDRDNPESAVLAQRLEAILRAPAHARAAGRLQAQAALDRGERLVDVEMAIPADFSGEVRRLDEAVRAADVLCDERRLLTLASPPELREFRTWMTEEIVGQVEQGAAPVPWAEWVASR
jgi:hypothetical protein